MNRIKKLISTVVLISFILNTAVSDLAFAQAPGYGANSYKLAVPLKSDDLMGIEPKDIGDIEIWFTACLAYLSKKKWEITLPNIQKFHDIEKASGNAVPGKSVFQPQGAKFLIAEMKPIEGGALRVVVKKGGRTYYAEFSPQSGGTVNVYPKGKASQRKVEDRVAGKYSLESAMELAESLFRDNVRLFEMEGKVSIEEYFGPGLYGEGSDVAVDGVVRDYADGRLCLNTAIDKIIEINGTWTRRHAAEFLVDLRVGYICNMLNGNLQELLDAIVEAGLYEKYLGRKTPSDGAKRPVPEAYIAAVRISPNIKTMLIRLAEQYSVKPTEDNLKLLEAIRSGLVSERGQVIYNLVKMMPSTSGMADTLYNQLFGMRSMAMLDDTPVPDITASWTALEAKHPALKEVRAEFPDLMPVIKAILTMNSALSGFNSEVRYTDKTLDKKVWIRFWDANQRVGVIYSIHCNKYPVADNANRYDMDIMAGGGIMRISSHMTASATIEKIPAAFAKVRMYLGYTMPLAGQVGKERSAPMLEEAARQREESIAMEAKAIAAIEVSPEISTMLKRLAEQYRIEATEDNLKLLEAIRTVLVGGRDEAVKKLVKIMPSNSEMADTLYTQLFGMRHMAMFENLYMWKINPERVSELLNKGGESQYQLLARLLRNLVLKTPPNNEAAIKKHEGLLSAVIDAMARHPKIKPFLQSDAYTEFYWYLCLLPGKSDSFSSKGLGPKFRDSYDGISNLPGCNLINFVQPGDTKIFVRVMPSNDISKRKFSFKNSDIAVFSAKMGDTSIVKIETPKFLDKLIKRLAEITGDDVLVSSIMSGAIDIIRPAEAPYAADRELRLFNDPGKVTLSGTWYGKTISEEIFSSDMPISEVKISRSKLTQIGREAGGFNRRQIAPETPAPAAEATTAKVNPNADAEVKMAKGMKIIVDLQEELRANFGSFILFSAFENISTASAITVVDGCADMLREEGPNAVYSELDGLKLIIQTEIENDVSLDGSEKEDAEKALGIIEDGMRKFGANFDIGTTQANPNSASNPSPALIRPIPGQGGLSIVQITGFSAAKLAWMAVEDKGAKQDITGKLSELEDNEEKLKKFQEILPRITGFSASIPQLLDKGDDDSYKDLIKLLGALFTSVLVKQGWSYRTGEDERDLFNGCLDLMRAHPKVTPFLQCDNYRRYCAQEKKFRMWLAQKGLIPKFRDLYNDLTELPGVDFVVVKQEADEEIRVVVDAADSRSFNFDGFDIAAFLVKRDGAIVKINMPDSITALISRIIEITENRIIRTRSEYGETVIELSNYDEAIHQLTITMETDRATLKGQWGNKININETFIRSVPAPAVTAVEVTPKDGTAVATLDNTPASNTGKSWNELANTLNAQLYDMRLDETPTQAASSEEAASRSRLRDIAAKIVPYNGGIIAVDETPGTAGKRLEALGLTNTPENRQAMRQLLLTVPGMKEAGISGVILQAETFDNTDKKGNNLAQKHLLDRGILPGIKVDAGLIDDPNNPGEKLPDPKGLENLPVVLEKFKAKGAVFTKWRATLTINAESGLPTNDNIRRSAVVFAKYAKMTQEAGLVPIVEPEVLLNGSHDIAASYRATTNTLKIVFEELVKAGVWMDGIILKSSMILSGDKAGNRADSETVGYQTLKGLLKTVPAEVPAIVFLSGGQADDEVNENLDAVIRAGRTKFEAIRDEAAAELESEGNSRAAAKLSQLTQIPWQLSYSFGRGLQRPGLKVWAGREENFGKAQEALLEAARVTQKARLGQLKQQEIDVMTQLASEVGLQILDSGVLYNLIVPFEFFKDNDEFDEHQGKYSSRFNLERAGGGTYGQFIANVLAKSAGKGISTVALVPDGTPTEQLERLTRAKIRFMRVNITELQKVRANKFEDANREGFQVDTYAIMLLLRRIDDSITVDSSLYRLLSFYLKSHFVLADSIAIDEYIKAVVNYDIAGMIKGYLRYMPIKAYENEAPEYHEVAVKLLTAA